MSLEHSPARDKNNILGLVSTEEAAALLGLKSQTLVAYRCESRGPRYYKIGRRCLYLPDDLKAWVAGQAVDPGREAV